MDLLAKLNIFSVPRWVRAGIILLLIFLGLVNTYLFVDGVWLSKDTDLAAASVQLLAVVLPTFIIALLLVQADTGTRALTLRTAQVLRTVVPDALSRLLESPSAFYQPSRQRGANPHKTAASIDINLVEGECYSDYRINAVTQDDRAYRIHIRVELNVHKVNFNLYVPRSHLDRPAAADATMDEISERLTRRFRHTIQGAVGKAVAGNAESGAPQGYVFNTVAIERRLEGQDYVCLVATRDLPADFLWNSSEQLYFANDLKLMVRSFMHEAPEYFSVVTPRPQNQQDGNLVAPSPVTSS